MVQGLPELRPGGNGRDCAGGSVGDKAVYTPKQSEAEMKVQV